MASGKRISISPQLIGTFIMVIRNYMVSSLGAKLFKECRVGGRSVSERLPMHESGMVPLISDYCSFKEYNE